MKSTRLLSRVYGGLGNQLFQFAACIKAAQLLRIESDYIFFDKRFIGSYETPRCFELDFLLPDALLNQIKYQLPFDIAMFSRFRFARLIDGRVGPYDFVGSASRLLTLTPSTSSTVILDGYFQDSRLLFDEHTRDIISKNIISHAATFVNNLRGVGRIVGLHIRRGDYTTSKVTANSPRVIPLEFYREALKKLSYKHVLVFSDDLNLAESFAKEVGGINISNLNLPLYIEFCIFASCDDYVIANSTFSWWASYFGISNGKRIISPKYWFRNYDEPDKISLLLEHFELLDI